jgi:hypothetical protein
VLAAGAMFRPRRWPNFTKRGGHGRAEFPDRVAHQDVLRFQDVFERLARYLEAGKMPPCVYFPCAPAILPGNQGGWPEIPAFWPTWQAITQPFPPSNRLPGLNSEPWEGQVGYRTLSNAIKAPCFRWLCLL